MPDAFELDSINLMVNLLAAEVDHEKLDPMIDMLHKLSLHYQQAVGKIDLLQNEMNTDQRTGLFRWQEEYFENILKNISRIFSSYQGEMDRYHLSYVRLDIDDFSRFNNVYGHELGDKVLRKVGETIKNTARPTDFCIRYGGEELDVILPATNLGGAKTFLDRLYGRFAELQVEADGREIPVTLSAGVTHVEFPYAEILRFEKDRTEEVHHRLQHEVDDALYEAKFLGKARWRMYDVSRAAEYPDIRRRYHESKHRPKD